MTTRQRSAKPVEKTAGERRRLPAELSQMNLNAAGIDVGATSHFVAVPADRAEPPVREFVGFTADLYRLADWLAEWRPCVPRQLYLPAHCLNKTVTQRKWLPQIKCYPKSGRQSRGRRHQQDGKTGIAGDDPRPLPSFIEAGESRILGEFIAVTRHHRKHGIRLLGQSGNDWEQCHRRRCGVDRSAATVVVCQGRCSFLPVGRS